MKTIKALAGITLMALTGIAYAAGVNINTADIKALDKLDGIGPAIAARIVEERQKAPFKDLKDLEKRVDGIGPATIEKNKDSIKFKD